MGILWDKKRGSKVEVTLTHVKTKTTEKQDWVHKSEESDHETLCSLLRLSKGYCLDVLSKYRFLKPTDRLIY